MFLPVLTAVIYLNGGGATLSNGLSDSTKNTSPLVPGVATLAPAGLDAKGWGALLSCVREAFGPFGAVVTDRDPGAADHVELVLAASSAPLGFMFPISGVAPFGCDGIPNAIAFTFVDAAGANTDDLCWTAVQEIGHTFGLEHELQCGDPMTYLTGCQNVTFRDVDARCGEDAPRACECGSGRQNSAARLATILGPGSSKPPVLAISSPAAGALLDAGSELIAQPTDDYAITRMTVELDGAKVGELRSAPWTQVLPARAGAGPHHIRTTVRNPGGAIAVDDRDVEVRSMCAADDACGEGRHCALGVCLSGIGASCADDGWCSEGMCRGDDERGIACRATCRLGDDTTCADGDHCEYLDGAAVCMPAAPSPALDASGCSTSGGATASAAVGLLLLSTLSRRRRQKGRHV